MKPELTETEKSELYDKGFYSFKVPPVCHAYWNKTDWIKYIDAHGIWQTDKVVYPGVF